MSSVESRPGNPGWRSDADADLFDDPSFLLARVNALSLAAGSAALSEHRLRVRSYSVLALAASGRQPTQRELAEFLRLDPSQVVALVDDLQSRSLVTRLPDPNDRRVNVVLATDEGRALHARAAVSVAAAQAEVLGGLGAAERRQLTALLRKLAFPDSAA
ncbi:MarR family winged helix-turn-helix transcriptional regulator [Microbacterium sp. DT81.1]|uniref:MarR family winged helix-turn-helix transcriptional regulator n=1 Tax=Microbacterium sp. DT81.1 TaxID=3393413 RepID=UPI003CEBD1B7